MGARGLLGVDGAGATPCAVGAIDLGYQKPRDLSNVSTGYVGDRHGAKQERSRCLIWR